jgi:hypothetical protein
MHRICLILSLNSSASLLWRMIGLRSCKWDYLERTLIPLAVLSSIQNTEGPAVLWALPDLGRRIASLFRWGLHRSSEEGRNLSCTSLITTRPRSSFFNNEPRGRIQQR